MIAVKYQLASYVIDLMLFMMLCHSTSSLIKHIYRKYIYWITCEVDR